MASFNWRKDRLRQKIKEQDIETAKYKEAKQDFWIFLEKGLWPVKGKHKGKPITELTTDYLTWIKNNFLGLPKDIAIKELRRRQNKKA